MQTRKPYFETVNQSFGNGVIVLLVSMKVLMVFSFWSLFLVVLFA